MHREEQVIHLVSRKVLRDRQRMTLMKDIPQDPSANSPTHHLYVFFDPLLVVTLGQNHNSTLYLVAKDNQRGSLLVLFGNGTKNWVLQENRVVQTHPGRKFRNAEMLRLSTHFMSSFSKQIKSVRSTPVLLKVWSMDQHDQHHLGFCQKYKFHGLAEEKLNQHLNWITSHSVFTKLCRWFGYIIDLRPGLLKLWVFSLISKGCFSSVIKGMNRETEGKTRDFFKFHFPATAAAAGKSLQLCPTPCDPIDSSPPGSPVPGILEARTLEQVAISFSNA